MSSRSTRLGVVLVAAMGLAGCVDNDISLANVAWVGPDEAMGSTMGCVYDSSSPILSRGIYDAGLANSLKTQTPYNVALQLQNMLQVITTEDVDTQVAEVSSFDVEIVPHGLANSGFLTGSELAYNYQVPTQRILPGNTAIFSIQAISGVHVTDGSLAKVATGQASITVRARPVYNRAEEQHTGSWASYPVDICDGCLGGLTYPVCSTLTGVTPLQGNACNFAADYQVTCCYKTKSDTTPLCGAEAAAAIQATM